MVLTLCSWGGKLARGMESSALLHRMLSTEGNGEQPVRERTASEREEAAKRKQMRPLGLVLLAGCPPSLSLAKMVGDFELTLMAGLQCSGRDGVGG